MAVTATVGLLARRARESVPAPVAAQAAPNGTTAGKSDVRHVGGDYNNGKSLPFSKEGRRRGSGVKSDQFQVGTVRQWPALDDDYGVVYSKQYVLMRRRVTTSRSGWPRTSPSPRRRLPQHRRRRGGRSSSRTSRSRASSTSSTPNIYPLESEVFSDAADARRPNTPLTQAYAQFYGLPARNFEGDGDRIVTLVDNVRDSNYYGPTAADGKTYIAGFFYSLFNNYTNRNVMTLDSWDWIHRTGAECQPDDTARPDYAACSE